MDIVGRARMSFTAWNSSRVRYYCSLGKPVLVCWEQDVKSRFFDIRHDLDRVKKGKLSPPKELPVTRGPRVNGSSMRMGG